MKTVEINGIKYEVIENVDNCLNVSELEEKITDYFDNYDYIRKNRFCVPGEL